MLKVLALIFAVSSHAFLSGPSGGGGGGGSVNSVTADAPVESTGGTDPVLSMPEADASTDGYLSATNFSAFANKWGLSGNSGTTAGTNFLGTTDAQDVVFKRNSTTKLTVGSAVTSSANVVQVPDGDATTPGLRLTTDGDTGLYQTGDGNLSISANGAQKVSVDQNATTLYTEAIAPSVRTPLVGTTSAADLNLAANSVNVLTVKSAYPGLSAGPTQVPANSVSINQFDLRTFVSPSTDVTDANHINSYSGLVWDNADLGQC